MTLGWGVGAGASLAVVTAAYALAKRLQPPIGKARLGGESLQSRL